ncbi:MAG: hypothetical protein JW849_00840, partial [Phycisphaerae bacterium]|nr:hypothetical protein [Phycisphaerae bacterium]
MQTVTIQPRDYFSGVVPCDSARVYIAGRRRRELQVLTWQVEPAPTFGRVRLAVQETLSVIRPVGLHQASRLPDVGSEALLRPALGFGESEFPGLVERHDVSSNQAGERLVAVVEHALASATRQTLLGRWECSGDSVVPAANKAPQFNTSSLTLACRRPRTFNGRAAPPFDPVSGERWSVAAALAYLIASALPRTVEAPSFEELDRLAGAIDLGAFDATGMSLAAALAEVAHRGGLEVRAARAGMGVVIYRPGRDGRKSHVRLQLSGRDLNAAETNISGGRIVVGRRPSRPPVRVVGATKQYEVTLPLQPGWSDEDASSRWGDSVRSRADDWHERQHVYRRWVLNEHARYTNAPAFDATTLGEDFLVRRARRFLPCFSADPAGGELGVIVEVRTSPTGPWRRWSGAIWAAEDECSITLGDDSLPADYFAAVVAGSAELRVTAVVESDRRIEAQADGDAGLPAELHDQSGRAFWRAVHPTSQFHRGGELPVVVRDDTTSLEAYARRRSDALGSTNQMTVTLGWVDTSCTVGDVVERLDGPGLELASQPHRQA